MKRILILASAFALMAGTAGAQDNPVKTTQKRSALAKQLDLTDQQQTKLQQVREQRKKEMAALNQSNPMRQWQEKKKALNKKYAEQQKSVLTKEQQAKALKLKKNAQKNRAFTGAKANKQRSLARVNGMPRKAAATRNRSVAQQKLMPRRQAIAPRRMAPQQYRRMAPAGRYAPAQRRVFPSRSVQARPGNAPSRMVRGKAAQRPGRNMQAGRNLQAGKNNFSLQRAPIATLDTKLNLTDAQKSTLTKSRDSYKAKAEAIKKNEKLSKDQKKKDLKALNKKHKEEMKSVLTNEQEEKMKSIKKRSRRR